MRTEDRLTDLSDKLPAKFIRSRAGAVGGIGAIALLGAIGYGLLQAKTVVPAPTATPAPKPMVARSVTALGRLEPRGEVIEIAPTTNGSRVARLLVKEGDTVKKGQIIAILDNHDRLQAELEQAWEQVAVNQSQLAQIEAGAKTGEIAAQRSTVQRLEAQLEGDRRVQQTTIDRLEAQLRGDVTAQKAAIRKLEVALLNARAEYQRYKLLNDEGAIADSTFDAKSLTLETSLEELNEAKANLTRTQSTGLEQINEAKATLKRIEQTGQQQINEARSTLDKIAEVRSVDVKAARTQVDFALAAVKKARAELALTYVRSPRDGQILKVHTWEGEVTGDNGIVELGQTDRMVAVAEVYESDVKRLKIGQKAVITSDAFTGKAAGTIEEIGLQIYKNNVLNTDPTAAADARIVEVKIQLDADGSRKVKAFTNLEVTVSIDVL